MLREMKLENKNDFTVVFVSGRMDISISEEIEKRLMEIVGSGVSKLIIDLGDVEYFSSSAMRVLIALKRILDGKKGILRLCRTSSMVNKIMSALELIKVFEIYDTLEDAIAAG